MSTLSLVIILFFYFLFKWAFRVAVMIFIGKLVSKGKAAIKQKLEGTPDA